MLKVPENQVAGHYATTGQLGPLVDGAGLFFKPFQTLDRGSNEVSFYTAFSSDPRVPSSFRLRFFPAFHGTRLLTDPSTGEPHPHIALEDLTFGLDRPSIIDFKIGARTWAPTHPQSYFEKCLKKDRGSTSVALGFRVAGLQIYEKNQEEWKPTRDEVRKFNADDVRMILKRYVEVTRGEVLEGVVEKLKELKGWFEEQTIWHFYSTSVIVMYEEGRREARVKLVDFTHVVDGEGVIDHNFLGGLCSLIKFVKEAIEGCRGEDEVKVCNGE